jgi:hypothetical protein
MTKKSRTNVSDERQIIVSPQVNAIAGTSLLASESYTCATLPRHYLHQLSANIIAVIRLTTSIINTCYDHQLRGVHGASIDLKATIGQLRGFSDVLHHLYTLMDNEDAIGSPRSSSISNLLSNDDGLLLQCGTELDALERILSSGISPLNEKDWLNALENLTRLQLALDDNKRLIS